MSLNRLPRSSPEQQGIRSSAVQSFVEAVEKDGLELHSFMLVRHGHVAAEGWWAPYAPERNHMMFSLSKSFTSTAIGMAVEEGRLSVDDSVISFFPDDVPADISDNLRAMRVRHLLSMSTGHDQDTLGRLFTRGDGNWAKMFLDMPVEHPPGTKFVYNSGATYMLSAIIQTLTGQTLMEYLQPRLFEHLGIEGAWWESCPRGINTGGWGLDIRTEDIAVFGQMYLQKGMWNGKRIVPEAWVEEASSSHISNGDDPNNDWAQGYGYQFWRCRHGAYRGDGAFGQYCIVMPEQDAVIAITSGLNDMGAVMNHIWSILLPAMGTEALPRNDEQHAALTQKLSSLKLTLPQGSPVSQTAAAVSGKRYALETNATGLQAVALDFSADLCTISIWDGRGKHELRCALGGEAWAEQVSPLPNLPQRVTTQGRWHDDQTFVMYMQYLETPFRDKVTLKFEDGRLEADIERNLAFFAANEPVRIRGIASN